MDDDSKTILKTGMEIALRPVTGIAENVLGLIGGDWLSEARARNREKLRAHTAEILKERRVDKPEEPPPSIAIPFLTQAQEESRDELVDLWAKLLACAMDPARKNRYRREYAEIVAKLEPFDAVVLEAAPSDEVYWTVIDPEKLAEQLQVGVDLIQVSLRNLLKLELAEDHKGQQSLTPLAREMLNAIHGTAA